MEYLGQPPSDPYRGSIRDPLLFAGRYRIPSARLATWDYTSPGAYFVTICTHRRVPWFGECRNGFTCVTRAGAIVAQEWHRTAAIRPYVRMGPFVVMPDHIHGIVIIGDTGRAGRGAAGRPGLRPNSWGSIINHFKSACTKRIRAAGDRDFGWQPRFHDHVIRSVGEYERIAGYIGRNPRTWACGPESTG